MRRTPLLCLLAVCALAVLGVGEVRAEDGGLIQRGEADRYVFAARDAPIAAALEELQARHGVEIDGREHVLERLVSGRFEGTMPEVIERIFDRENFVLYFRDDGSAAGATVSRLVFVGASDEAPAAAVVTDAERDVATRERDAAARERRYYESLPPPSVPELVAEAIAPPPPNTPERKAFDEAVARTAAELEEALRPLREIGN